MTGRADIKSTLLWILVLFFAIFNLITDLGIRFFTSILEIIALLDWVAPLLVVAASLNSELSPISDVFELIFSMAICYEAVRRVSNLTDYSPRIRSVEARLALTCLLWIFYIQFAIFTKGYPTIFPELSYQTAVGLSYSFLIITSSIAILLPWLVGLFRATEPNITIRGRVGPTLAAIYLLTGGLATLGTIEMGLAVLALLVAVIRLTGSSVFFGIVPENWLIRLLLLLEKGPLGFAVILSSLTGIFLIARGFEEVSSLWPIVYLTILNIFPISGKLITIIGIFAIGVLGLLILTVFHLNILSLAYGLERVAVILFVIIWFQLIGIIWWRSFVGPDTIAFNPQNLIVYAVLLASGLIVAGIVEKRYKSQILYYGSLIGIVGLLAPYYLQQNPFSSVNFLNLAVIGYLGGPIFQRLGELVMRLCLTVSGLQ